MISSKPALAGFLGFVEAVRVIGVEKYGQIGLLAHAPDQRRRLGDANEGALALGNPDHHGHLQVASRRDNRIEGDEVREVEVTHRDSPAARIVEHFDQGFHKVRA